MSLDMCLFFPPGYGFDNSAPAITVPAAQTVYGNLTGVTPKTTLAVPVSVADADGDDQEVTATVLHGTLTLGPSFDITIGSATNTNSIVEVRARTTAGAWTLTVLGIPVALNATTDSTISLQAALGAAITHLPGSSAAASNVTIDGAVTVYHMEFDSGSFHVEEESNVTIDLTFSELDNDLTFTVGDGIDDATMTFSGSFDDVNDAIGGMFYTPEDDYAGSDTITVDAEDENGGVATQKTVAIAVTPSLHGLELLLPLTADVNDTSGKANNLTNNGVTFAASGVTGFGNCGVFAGGTDAARADDADLSFGDEDFTIGAFVLHTATGDHDAIMSKGIAGSSTDYEYTLRIGSDDKLAFEVSNGSADATKFHSTAVAAATWSFVAGVHDSVNNLIKTRLNGVTQTGAYSSGCADGAYLLSVGSRAGAFPLDGRMMYVFVFRRALSEAELDSLYNGGAFRKLVP